MAVVGLGLLQAQRLLGGNDVERVLDREVYLDFDNMEISPLELCRSSRCLSGHIRWELCDLDRDAAETTLDDLFAAARKELGASSETSDIVLEPHLHPLCLAAFCDCGAVMQAVGSVWAVPPRCPDCKGRMHWRRDLKWRRLAPRHVEELAIGGRSLSDLGLPERGSMVTASSKGGSSVRFVLN